ncbi:MAG: ribose-phosphate pyrophosphokinase [Phycisphaerae bacterium]|jgi:ribose-phosphate pyrophosphokinase|nr:MAG: ribose-phosphate pyrophosphokinase [Planctomycetes bacterium GWC2_45_44]HBG78224.1 ribose-phosphate diphosphokinase [Phycisphaerales bacterium]HBR18777.1 ribose-phosphate diphosphokinase [Phycisphaerales bacterium]
MFLSDNIKVFSGSSNLELTARICKYLGVPIGGAKVERFPDGEKIIKCEDDVRGKDCFVVQSGCEPVDENIVELLIFLDCLKRASATRVTAVIPYFGYARQDRKDEGRVPITAKLMSNLIATAGADRVLAMDLHAAQLQGFFDIPVDHLFAEPVLTKHFRDKKIDNLTIVSPDVGNIKRAARYVRSLNGDLAIIHKRRVSANLVEACEMIGSVEGRNVIMCDDIISTAGTIATAAKIVKERGAKKVFVGATHGIFCGPAIERINEAPIDEIVVTDTVPLDEKAGKIKNLKVLTVCEILGEAIKRIHRNESISAMFHN